MAAILLFLSTFFNLVVTHPKLFPPVQNFSDRITKKEFGTFVTPQNSPVTPEKFTGYHTGVDVEFADVDAEVPVNAVSEGKIIFSGIVTGYGGVVIEQIDFEKLDYLVLYGHLSPSSLIAKNTRVATGDKIAILGKGYSAETDGERRHLHLAFIRGTQVNFRGYTPRQSGLSSWQNPLDFF